MYPRSWTGSHHQYHHGKRNRVTAVQIVNEHNWFVRLLLAIVNAFRVGL